MVYTPGYYVHQWNLHNRDLVRPLYVSAVFGFSGRGSSPYGRRPFTHL